jgi:hypothetical protein
MMHDSHKSSSQHMLVKKEVRKHLKIQKNIHKSKVRAQRNKLQLMLSKQEKNAYRMIEKKQAVIIPQIMNTRKGLKTRKQKRRIIELNTGKNLFSYSTIPSGELSDNLQSSLRYSTITNLKLSERMKNFYEYTLVPDLNFTDLFVFSQKPLSKNPRNTPALCRKRKEVSKKQLAMTPKYHISGPRTVLRTRLRTNKQVK